MNRNSALLWLPRIEAISLPTPRTIIVPYSHHATLAILDGEPSPEAERLSEKIRKAGEAIGWPVFIRSDLTSAKHSGPRAYRIDKPDQVGSVMCQTIEDNELKMWLERDGPKAILVRQFLELDHGFTCFSDLPIAREWRLFSDGGRVLCKHPYWPAESLEEHFYVEEPAGWREILADHHTEPPEMPELERMAIVAARVQGFDCKPEGSWSVDFARDTAGKWWLIDMATMQDSYHWPGCPKS